MNTEKNLLPTAVDVVPKNIESASRQIVPENKHTLLAQNILSQESDKMENIVSDLKERFGEDVPAWITKLVQDTGIDGLIKANNILGRTIFSSCFHPNEFPVDPYGLTSLFNTYFLAKELGLEVNIAYLDNYNEGGKWKGAFHSTETGKPNIFAQISDLTKLDEINDRDYIRSIREFSQDFSEKIFAKLKNGAISKEISAFFNEMYQGLGIFEEITQFAQSKGMKTPDGQEGKKKEDTAEFDAFKVYFLKKNFEEYFVQLIEIYRRRLLNERYKNSITEAEKYAELQNAILTMTVENHLTREQHKMIRELGLFDRKGVNLEISYNNGKYYHQHIDAVNALLSDEKLWKDLFFEYFSVLWGRKNPSQKQVEIFSYGNNGRERKVCFSYDEAGELILFEFFDKKATRLSADEFFEKMTDKSQKINMSGNIALFLSALAGQLQVGSERNYRDYIEQALRQHFLKKDIGWEKIEAYIQNVVQGARMVDTFVPGEDATGRRLSGSSGVVPNDLFALGIIGGHFAISQMQQTIVNNEKMPEVDRDLLFQSFLKTAQDTMKRLQDMYAKNGNESDQKLQDTMRGFQEKVEKYHATKDENDFYEIIYFCFQLDKFLQRQK